MLILKKNKSVILLYFLLGAVVLGNLGCASSNCSQPQTQKIVPDTDEKSKIKPVDKAVAEIVTLFSVLSSKPKTSTETSQSSDPPQDTTQLSSNKDIDVIRHTKKLDLVEITGNCVDKIFDIYEPAEGICEMALDTIGDSNDVDCEPVNIVTIQQECAINSLGSSLGFLAEYLANGGSFGLW